jgi:cell division transport system permease protein
MVNCLIFFNALADSTIKLVEEKVDLSIFFKPEVTEGKALEIKSVLIALPQVREIQFISKDEALQIFKDKHKNEPKILEAVNEVGANPLGASLIVKAYRTEDYQIIFQKLNDPTILPPDLVQDKNFDDHKLLIDKISNIKQKVSKAGIFFSIIFGLIAILIVFNTIRVAIYTHREEIGVMRLVGATSWFVRVPFIIESIFYALAATLISIIILYPFIGFVQPYVVNFFEGAGFDLLNYFNANFLKIFGLELLASIVLGIISSTLAVGKYLKV